LSPPKGVFSDFLLFLAVDSVRNFLR